MELLVYGRTASARRRHGLPQLRHSTPARMERRRGRYGRVKRTRSQLSPQDKEVKRNTKWRDRLALLCWGYNLLLICICTLTLNGGSGRSAWGIFGLSFPQARNCPPLIVAPPGFGGMGPFTSMPALCSVVTKSLANDLSSSGDSRGSTTARSDAPELLLSDSKFQRPTRDTTEGF
jgi:hypothetical protein